MDNVGNNLESKKQAARCYMQQYNVHTFYSNKIPLSSIYEYKYTYNKIKKKHGLDTHQIHDKVASGERRK